MIRQILEQPWYLGETIITGIGQGYIQTTPIQLCLMTAQLANGGYKIKPNIIFDKDINFEKIKLKIQENKIEKLYQNPNNVKFVLDAMFGSTNELYGTSFKSRHENVKYQFAGKTGTSQVKRITEKERELDLDLSEIE